MTVPPRITQPDDIAYLLTIGQQADVLTAAANYPANQRVYLPQAYHRLRRGRFAHELALEEARFLTDEQGGTR